MPRTPRSNSRRLQRWPYRPLSLIALEIPSYRLQPKPNKMLPLRQSKLRLTLPFHQLKPKQTLLLLQSKLKLTLPFHHSGFKLTLPLLQSKF